MARLVLVALLTGALLIPPLASASGGAQAPKNPLPGPAPGPQGARARPLPAPNNASGGAGLEKLAPVFATFIGAADGIHLLRDDRLEALGLDGERVSAVHAWRAGDATTVLAGTYGNGLHRSTDAGASWSPVDAGLTASAFRCIGPDPWRPGAIPAGPEPARLVRKQADGQTGTD